jgi:peptidoglycan/xylan/chitin deacetylase (PgdA/CDA1 family)
MNRRQALRASIAAAAGLAAAGCEGSGPTTSAARPARSGASPTPGTPAQPSPVALPPEVTRGPVTRPAVALTFHGQGDPPIVRQLLTELGAAGARVTVLAVGTWLSTQPALARRILDGGHELGNHTQHHGAIAQMNAAQTFAEIDDCAQMLRRLTGSIGTWFRPSQIQHATALIQAQARRVGYGTCLSYDVDSRDYTDPPAATVVHNTLSAVTSGSIVSMHFGHAVTIAAIGPILDGLRRRGLHTATMTELVAL